MKTRNTKLIINREDLVNALMRHEHASSSSYDRKYIVAYDPEEDECFAEIVWAENGEAPYIGWAAENPESFLDYANGFNDFTWNDDDNEEVARDWINSNLCEEVELEYNDDTEEGYSIVKV